MTFKTGDRVRITDNAGLITSTGWTGLTATVVQSPASTRRNGTLIRLDKGLRRGDNIGSDSPFVWNTESLALLDEVKTEGTTFVITAPSEGEFSVNLSAKDAEILLRVLGKANSGNLRERSPELYKFVEELVNVFGRDFYHEAKNYTASVFQGQVYVDKRGA